MDTINFYKKILDNLYVGNSSEGFTHANIIINVGSTARDDDGKPVPKCVRFGLPKVELVSDEYEKVMRRLEKCSKLIIGALDCSLYLYSYDNLQGILLMLGYTMIKLGLWDSNNVVEKLDTLLFTESDRKWEQANSRTMQKAFEDNNIDKYTQLLSESPKRIFTSKSFRQILMSVKK